MKTFKKKVFIVLACIVCFITVLTYIVKSNTLEKKVETTFGVMELIKVTWGGDGVIYEQRPSVNLGITSFTSINNELFALLSNSADEILVTDSKNRIINRISIEMGARDIEFDEELFYVLYAFDVRVYNQKGENISVYTIDSKFNDVFRVKRYEGGTYVHLASGNSLLIEQDGISMINKETKGWITSNGVSYFTTVNHNNTFGIEKLINDNSSKMIITNDKTVLSVLPIDVINDDLILEIETQSDMNPDGVDKYLLKINYNEGQIVARLKIPNVYYTDVSKQFTIKGSNIYNLISAPDGVFVFLLESINTDGQKITLYPDFLTNKPYHYNDHIIKLD